MIEEASNLYHTTILGSLSDGTIWSLTGTGILSVLKMSKKSMLSNRGIETITKNLPLSKTVVQVRV